MAQRSDGSLQQKRGDKTEGRKNGEQTTSSLWCALKRYLKSNCESSDVYDPKATRKSAAGCCGRSSTSIADTKDFNHGSKTRHVDKPLSCSPQSVGSNELLNPTVILGNSRSELKITGSDGGTLMNSDGAQSASFRRSNKIPQSNLNGESRRSSHGSEDSFLSSAVSGDGGLQCTEFAPRSSAALIRHKCDEQFLKLETLEAHHLSTHAVTELVEGVSSRKIVEMICKTSLSKSDSSSGQIERILKVHSLQRTLSSFEEYREMVKLKASMRPKKHPRCLADGNELLRFHGAAVACSLGKNGSSGLCTSERCEVCQILRQGFSIKKGSIGVFTAATSERALECINGDDPTMKRALFVCRVIAGRVHRPLDDHQEMADQSGFDSLAGKIGSHANIEELYLLNQRALLPCFVVVCKT